MSDELKKSIEKKRKIAELIAIVGLYVLVVGIAIAFIGLFQANAVEQYMDEEHMIDPTIPYNERDNATFIITPDSINKIHELMKECLIMGGIIAGVGLAILITLAAVTPSKKERHKLLCGIKPFGTEIIYCPSCGLKLSLLDKK